MMTALTNIETKHLLPKLHDRPLHFVLLVVEGQVLGSQTVQRVGAWNAKRLATKHMATKELLAAPFSNNGSCEAHGPEGSG